MKTLCILLSTVAALSLPACTAERAYGSAQAWQQNQCSRIPDKAEAGRCMSKANTSYDSYKQQNESGQKQ
jgi:outer membrane biogenesis lipoprotein LolB